MNTFLVSLYLIILGQTSSVETDSIVFCGKPEFPEAYYDGHVVAAAPDTQLKLICKRAYTPGSPTTTCKDGQWTDPSPPCKLVECRHEDLVTPNVLINHNCLRLRLDCVADLTCMKGYWYDGPMVKKCQENGNWSGPAVLCEEIQCNVLPTISKGKVNHRGRHYLAIATIQCDMGYIYSQSKTRQCQANNTWSGENGQCTARGCPTIPDVPNGILSANTGSFKDRILLQCNTGYILDGDISVNCTAFGNWSAKVGKCRLKDDSGTDMKLILGVSIPMVIIVIITIITAVMCVRCRAKRRSRHEPSIPLEPSITQTTNPENQSEMQPLLDNSVVNFESHFTFLMAEDLGNAYSDESEYNTFISTIQDAIVTAARKVHITISVTLLYVCRTKRRGFLTTYADSAVKEKDLITAISASIITMKKGEVTHTYSIQSASIKVVDGVQNARSAEILREKHVKDMSLDDKIDFDTQYVKLRIHTHPTVGIMQRGDIERPDQDNLTRQGGAELEDEDLIKNGDLKKYVLLRGRAGIGKSTLMQRLLWKWANGEWATHLRVIFLLNLQYLMTISKPMDLLYMLNVHSAYNTGRSDFTMDNKWLKENEMGIAFVLDGVDQVRNFRDLWENTKLQNMSEPIQWCFALMRRELLQSSTIIVSSRPFADLSYIGQTLKEKSLYNHLQLVELMGLTRERVKEFVNKNVQEGSRDFVWQTLDRNPILMSISYITFYCAALCKVLGEWRDAPVQLKTYTQITAYIIDIFIQRSLQKVESPFKVGEILQVLSNLALHGLMREIGKGPLRLVFDEKDIAELSIEKNVTNIMIKTGLLMQTEILDPEDKERCTVLSQFVHLMIQEFLAMAGLLSQSPKEFKRLLKELSKTQQFSMAKLFLYGLAFNTENEVLKKLNISMVCEKQLDLNREELRTLAKNMPDKLQAMQVAHESQSADVARIVGLHNFEEGCRIENTKVTVIDILALNFVLEHNRSIRTIRLERAELDKTSVTELSKFLKSQNSIEELALVDDTLDDECVEELMLAVKDCNGLEALEMSSDSMTDKGLHSVASAMMTSKTVVRLNLSSDAVTDTGVKTLAHALKLSTTLRSLRILFRRMTNKGVQLLAASLKASKTLEEFWLIDTSMTDDGVKELSQALRINTSVKNLRVDSRVMTDDGLVEIANSLAENRSLMEIRLHSQNITDEGVKYFMSRLKDQGILTDIALSGFYMTEDAVSAILDTMMAVPALTIGMWEPDVSDAVLQEVRANNKIRFI